jgi:hypothetical protein
VIKLVEDSHGVIAVRVAGAVAKRAVASPRQGRRRGAQRYVTLDQRRSQVVHASRARWWKRAHEAQREIDEEDASVASRLFLLTR